MMYSNDKNHKTPNVSQNSKKHTFREQFATGAGRGKKNAVCVMRSKIRPKGKRNKDTGSNCAYEN